MRARLILSTLVVLGAVLAVGATLATAGKPGGASTATFGASGLLIPSQSYARPASGSTPPR